MHSQQTQFFKGLSFHLSEGIMRVKILCPLPAIPLSSLLACSYVAMPLHHKTSECHQSRSRATSLETYSSLRIPWDDPFFDYRLDEWPPNFIRTLLSTGPQISFSKSDTLVPF